jgi:hypothetical protein
MSAGIETGGGLLRRVSCGGLTFSLGCDGEYELRLSRLTNWSVMPTQR